jgi:hypothetical protein
MNYTLLIYQTPAEFALRADPAEIPAYRGGWMAYRQALIDAGVMAGGAGLEGAETARTLRIEAAATRVQDGPFADTKEQLAGYFIVDVPDIDSALDWARKMPLRPGMAVEVRPNLVVPPPKSA